MKYSQTKTNLLIIGIVIIALAAFAFIFMGIGRFFELLFLQPGFASILLAVIFILIAIRWRLSWKHYGVFLVVGICVAGLAFDYIGNDGYNAIFNWLFAGAGNSIRIVEDIDVFGGTTSISFGVQVVNQAGEYIRNVNGFVFAAYRFFQYLGLYSIGLTLISLWTDKHPREPKAISIPEVEPFGGEIEFVDNLLSYGPPLEQLDEYQKRMLLSFLMGEHQIEAIRYLKQHEALSLAEAKQWIDKWYAHWQAK